MTNLINNKASNEELIKFFNLPKDTEVVSGDRNKYRDINGIFILRSSLRESCFEYALCLIKKTHKGVPNTIHNPSGPASIMFDYDFVRVFYREYGKIHRQSGPAKIIYDLHGNIIEEEYRINDQLHNPIGPARRVIRDMRGIGKLKRWYNYFYIHNKEIPLDRFCKRYEKYAKT